MEKKVGIITSYLDFNKNYGGVLQAYALAKQLSLLGYAPYIMPYIYEHIPLKDKNDLLHIVYRKVRHILNPYRKAVNQQKDFYRIMMDFVNQHMPMYADKRITLSEMQEIASDFHAFICGSDQVWSTNLQKGHCDPGMFLKFVPSATKKIAYAPSTGSTTAVTDETAAEIKEALSDFDAISIRETTGQQLLERITGNTYPIVLDPTLLLPWDQWDDIARVPDNLPEKYILVYRFGNLESNFNRMIDIQKHLGLPIIELPSSLVSLQDNLEKRYDIDAGQFIGLIKNATLVCTDSFHATVFSIINKTPFISFYRQDPAVSANMNARVDNLLATTGLSHRIVGVHDDVDYDNLLNVDFDEAHRRIEALRAPALTYLSDALTGELL